MIMFQNLAQSLEYVVIFCFDNQQFWTLNDKNQILNYLYNRTYYALINFHFCSVLMMRTN